MKAKGHGEKRQQSAEVVVFSITWDFVCVCMSVCAPLWQTGSCSSDNRDSRP